MGDVVYGNFGANAKKEKKDAINTAVPQKYQDFAEKYNLEIEVTGGGESFFIHGKSFRTPKGEKVQSSFGYLRPTGKCQTRPNGDEEIEVVCMRTGRTKFFKLSVLQPFRFVDSLED